MQTLMKIKRDIRKKIYKGSNTEEERIILQQRERIINEHMDEVNRKCFTQRITNTANEIKEGGGVNSGKFWEFKRKLDIKKKEEKIAMKDEDGMLQEDIEINKIIFEKFYKKLLTSPEPRNEKEMNQEQEVNECFKQLELLAKYTQEKEITINEVEQTIKQLKNKKVWRSYRIKK